MKVMKTGRGKFPRFGSLLIAAFLLPVLSGVLPQRAPPLSPLKSGELVEELELVPYGTARLRITEFPTIEKD